MDDSMKAKCSMPPPSLGTAWIQGLKIGPRLAVGSLIPLLLFVVFAAWLWSELGHVRSKAEIDVTEGAKFALLAKDMTRNVTQVQQFLSDVSATRCTTPLA